MSCGDPDCFECGPDEDYEDYADDEGQGYDEEPESDDDPFAGMTDGQIAEALEEWDDSPEPPEGYYDTMPDPGNVRGALAAAEHWPAGPPPF